jgi:hypothetical protein
VQALGREGLRRHKTLFKKKSTGLSRQFRVSSGKDPEKAVKLERPLGSLLSLVLLQNDHTKVVLPFECPCCGRLYLCDRADTLARLTFYSDATQPRTS